MLNKQKKSELFKCFSTPRNQTNYSVPWRRTIQTASYFIPLFAAWSFLDGTPRLNNFPLFTFACSIQPVDICSKMFRTFRKNRSAFKPFRSPDDQK